MKSIEPAQLERARESFARQSFMRTLGAEVVRVEPGAVDIEFHPNPHLEQQNGFLHAGVVASVADSACGYAAYTLMPKEADVLTVEFKINLLAPAVGSRFVARGRVIRPGRTLTVCQADVFASTETGERQIALVTATVMTMLPR